MNFTYKIFKLYYGSFNKDVNNRTISYYFLKLQQFLHLKQKVLK